jgi:hypothetical protein
MSSHLQQKYQRGKYILQKEGLLSFVMEGIRFLRKSVFVHERYYMCESPLSEPMKFVSTPKIQDFVFEIITTGQRLEELMAHGFDFGIDSIGAEERLDKGAIMFCIFIGKELACVHWAAATQEAMNVLTKISREVDFSNNEVYLGWSHTDPKYRRLGLSTYLISEKVRLFATMGKTTGKWFVEKGNLPSQKITIKAGGRIYSEGRYLKILWWKSRKEEPIIQEAD